VFTQYGEAARAVLNALLDKYADQGIASIEDKTVLQLDPFARMGTTVEITQSFGGKQRYKVAIQALKQLLYEDQGA